MANQNGLENNDNNDNRNQVSNNLTPFVLWGQDYKNVTLKVELRSVELPDVNLTENSISFQSFGIGQQGENNYNFKFDFFDSINPKESIFKVNENSIEFLVKKKTDEIWPRLTINKLRRPWLKVNFEKSCWLESDDDLSLDKIRNEELEFYQRNDLNSIGSKLLFDNLQDLNKRQSIQIDRKPISNVEFMRKFYLVLYNLIQLYGSVYLLTSLFLRYDGSTSSYNAPRDLKSTIDFLSYVKLFEILHQVFGFVFNKDRTIWFVVFNRIFMFCILIEFETRLVNKPVVFYLILLYAILDIVNYIYYILRVLDVHVRLFKWLKCTIWIPIYPLIFLCEAVILLRAIPYYEETKKLTFELPNSLNFSFPFLILLKFYTFFVFTPVMYLTMNNFYKNRIKCLKQDDRQARKRN